MSFMVFVMFGSWSVVVYTTGMQFLARERKNREKHEQKSSLPRQTGRIFGFHSLLIILVYIRVIETERR